MKRILSLALAVLMLVSALPVAYAADYTAGTQVTYTADDEANREYTITVPASMEPGQSGTVTLKGKWASNETVKVTADANVVLTNSINGGDQKTLAITFAGIEKAGDNTVEKTYTEDVSVAAMPADALFGTWSGKFNYNVEFETVNLFSFNIICEKGYLSDGTYTYQAEEGMTWGEWVESEYNTDGYYAQGNYVYTHIRGYDHMDEFDEYITSYNDIAQVLISEEIDPKDTFYIGDY